MIEGHGDDLHRYGGIKSNFSSNVYPFADLTQLKRHLKERMDLIASYPQPSAVDLERRIAKCHMVDDDQVLVTNGATEAIYLIAETFRDMHSFHVYQPTFSEYADACLLMGCKEQDNAYLGWLCNPNNPTGMVTSIEDMDRMRRCHEILVVDESYQQFTMETMLQPHEAVRMDNIILIKSMTKRYGIPGLRLGYVIAPSRLIRQLKRFRRPWAVNALALEAGMWLLDHERNDVPELPSYLRETQWLRQRLNEIGGVTTMETQTHFFLSTIEGHTAGELKQYLAERHGMLIRDASNFPGLTPHHFRICTRSHEENDALVKAIRQFVDGDKKVL